MSFFEELKRRNVIRVGIAYTVGAWLLLQLTEVLIELLELPGTAGKYVILILVMQDTTGNLLPFITGGKDDSR